jgi:hypothetical protein
LHRWRSVRSLQAALSLDRRAERTPAFRTSLCVTRPTLGEHARHREHRPGKPSGVARASAHHDVEPIVSTSRYADHLAAIEGVR